MAIQLTQGTKSRSQAVEFACVCSVNTSVVIFGVLPEGRNQLVYGQIESPVDCVSQAPTIGLPFAQDASIFRSTFGATILSEEQITTTPNSIG
jgi:hypothetical protein